MIKDDVNKSRVSIAVHVIAAIAMGCFSQMFSIIYPMFTRWLWVGAGVVVLLGIGFVVQFVIAKDKDIKWWLGNGAVVYLFFWIVSWVFIYNLSI